MALQRRYNRNRVRVTLVDGTAKQRGRRPTRAVSALRAATGPMR